MLLVEEYKSYWSYIVLIHSTCPARPKSPCESSWNRWCRDLESWDNWWGIFRRTSPHPMQGSLLLRHFIETLGLMVLWYQRLGSVSWTFFSNGIPPIYASMVPRYITQLQTHIGEMDKHYDRCNEAWATGEVEKFKTDKLHVSITKL